MPDQTHAFPTKSYQLNNILIHMHGKIRSKRSNLEGNRVILTGTEARAPTGLNEGQFTREASPSRKDPHRPQPQLPTGFFLRSSELGFRREMEWGEWETDLPVTPPLARRRASPLAAAPRRPSRCATFGRKREGRGRGSGIRKNRRVSWDFPGGIASGSSS